MDMDARIAAVAIPRPVEGTFDYQVPEALTEMPSGVRVLVQFGKDKVVGYVLQRKKDTDYGGKLLPILACLDDEPILSTHALDLARWMSRYYLCPLGLVLQAMLPQRLSRAKPSRSKVVSLSQDLAQTLRSIERLKGSAPQQAHLLQTLLSASVPTTQELLSWTRSSPAPLRALVEKGLISLRPQPVTGIKSAFEEAEKKLKLTAQQREALSAIETALDQEQGIFLLQGVNGSGKTEIYLRAVQRALQRGKTALLLVPEISLTPQLLARFRNRLGKLLAVLHSGLTDAQRAREWSRLREGEAQVVLGVRSASLLPLDHLGLIIVDEEHEPTYKQESPEPRYHTRNVVLQRAITEHVVAIFGSATPSLEMYQQAQHGNIQHLVLPERVVSAPLPAIETVDMHNVKGWLSPALESALNDTLAQGKQAMLLLNRRGYGVTLCQRCRHIQRCSSCGITLTFHAKPAQLRCHYCNATLKRNVCQLCQGELDLFGLGTQRAEHALRKKFTSARIMRMDSDAVKRGQHGQMLNRFRAGQIDILLGTQMIGLGHDFQNVSLMGILDADTLLHLPDFRASERTFQLVSQAAGRAGRGDQPGRVILQTRHPGHYVFRHAARNDYAAFAKEELRFRKDHFFPPYSHLIHIETAHHNEDQAQTSAQLLCDSLVELGDLEVLGPSRCLPYRWRGKARWQLLIKINDPLEKAENIVDRIKHLGLTQEVKVNVDP